jgi:hypothetical protein
MRFTIRDLLWLTLLAAVAVAWWIDRSRLAAAVERLRQNDETIRKWHHIPGFKLDVF